MPLAASEILLKHVCPGLGNLIALVLFSTPLRAVLEVNRKKSLGEMNVLPFIAMTVNCFSWIIYGYVCHNWYIYFGNLPGMLFGMFYVLTCYKFSKEQAQDMLRNIFLGSCLVFFVVGLVSLAAMLDEPAVKTLWGSTSVAILAVYYAAPLTSLAKVVAQRDSSSLHWPLCCMNSVNGTLWFAYGMALQDWFVAGPNGVGAAFNVICLAFCFVFPAKGRSRLQGQVNPAANWAVLRLQSVRNPDTGARGFQSLATAGGFFDLSQFRWRSGAAGSFLRVASGGRLGSGRHSSTAAAAGADAEGPAVLPVVARSSTDSPADSGTPDCKVQDLDLVVVEEEKAAEGSKAAPAAGAVLLP